MPDQPEPPPLLPGPTGPPPPGSRTVMTDDGVPLHVEFDGDPDAPLTVLFSHGFTARLVEWDLQRAALRHRARLVLWDQRGHGRSGWTRLTAATIDRTGRDLGTVLDAVAPTGPVVLAGHSMGGMSIMALARQRPELFGTRIVGAFLLATSAGGLAETGLLGLAVRLLRRLGLLTLYLWLAQGVIRRHKKGDVDLSAERQYPLGLARVAVKSLLWVSVHLAAVFDPLRATRIPQSVAG